MSFDWVALNLVFNGLGAIFYSTRVSRDPKCESRILINVRFQKDGTRTDLISGAQVIRSCIV